MYTRNLNYLLQYIFIAFLILGETNLNKYQYNTNLFNCIDLEYIKME